MMLPVPELLVKLLGERYLLAASLLYGSAAFFLLVALFIAWLIFGRGPRRRRRMKQARSLAKAGNWQEALEVVRKLRLIGAPSASWKRRFDQLEGECHQASYQESLAEKEYEEALERGAK